MRPFAVHSGSVAASAGPGLLSLVVARRLPGQSEELYPEREAVLRLAQCPQTVVELAAHLGLPLSVVKLIVSDMITSGSLDPCEPLPEQAGDGFLQKLLDGLRAL